MNELRAFVALADTGSFVGAGRQLRKDPAIISRRLRALEARLGVRLAERTTRVVHLSEAGHAYLARVRPLLDGLERADQEAADFAGGEPSGHLRISLPGDFGRLWLGPIINGFLLAHPHVTIEVDASNRFVDLVRERYDLAVRLGVLADSRLIARKVADRRRLLCASPAYLARRGNPGNPTELNEHACLCFTGRQDPNRWSFNDPGNGVVSVTVSGPLAATDAGLLVDAAVAGLGILYTTDWYVGQELVAGRLIEVLPDWPPIDRGAVYVVTPAAAGVPSKARAFSNWIAEAFRRPPWHEASSAKNDGFSES